MLSPFIRLLIVMMIVCLVMVAGGVLIAAGVLVKALLCRAWTWYIRVVR